MVKVRVKYIKKFSYKVHQHSLVLLFPHTAQIYNILSLLLPVQHDIKHIFVYILLAHARNCKYFLYAFFLRQREI